MTVVKFSFIAFLAAVAASLPPVLSFYVEIGLGHGSYDPFAWSLGAFQVALMGCFMIGLPVALLIFWFSGKHLIEKPSTLILITALSIVMMLLAAFVIGDGGAMLVFGLPSALAAITFAALGYRWVIRPVREARDA